MNRLLPYLLMLLPPLFWSGNFVLARGMHAEMPPMALSFLRWALALLIILPWVIPKWRAEWPQIRRHWKILLLLSVLGVVNFNSFVYTGLQTTSATNAALLQSAVPVVILLLSRLMLGHPIRPLQLLGILVSLCGVLNIIGRGDPLGLLALEVSRGDLWILAAVLSWALYSICLRWRPEGLSPLTLLGTTIAIGVVILLPFFLWERAEGLAPDWQPATYALVVYVGIFPSLLAYHFWNLGVANLGAAVAGLFVHLMPVFGLILSFILLNEQVQAFHLFGIVLIFSGIYLATGVSALKAPIKNQE